MVWAEHEHLGLVPRRLINGPTAAGNIDRRAVSHTEADGRRQCTYGGAHSPPAHRLQRQLSQRVPRTVAALRRR